MSYFCHLDDIFNPCGKLFILQVPKHRRRPGWQPRLQEGSRLSLARQLCRSCLPFRLLREALKVARPLFHMLPPHCVQSVPAQQTGRQREDCRGIPPQPSALSWIKHGLHFRLQPFFICLAPLRRCKLDYKLLRNRTVFYFCIRSPKHILLF